ncbi:50S ribosomal protein L22 [Candidatus Woesearchaeota archaeon]|nr:50S ribosomal protein L22 [Candidatus Woesearchaeota archaeon]
MTENEHIATARGTNLGISTKFATEIARFVRGKSLVKAKKELNGVLEQKVAVPFKRYIFDLGHKRGASGPGRYPIKATKEILVLLESAEANAENKGLDKELLYVQNVIANKGTTQVRAGRKRARHTKRTHVQVILVEKEKKKEEKSKEEKKEKSKK